jgi:hypothetical protein
MQQTSSNNSSNKNRKRPAPPYDVIVASKEGISKKSATMAAAAAAKWLDMPIAIIIRIINWWLHQETLINLSVISCIRSQWKFGNNNCMQLT